MSDRPFDQPDHAAASAASAARAPSASTGSNQARGSIGSGGAAGSDGSPLLEAEHLALLAAGVSVIVASRNVQQLASAVRAVGFRLESTGEVTVFVSRADGPDVLDDLKVTGAIAVVFSQPSTHRTLQLKGSGVRIDAARPDDLAAIEACCDAIARDLAQVGFGSEFARALHAFEPAELVAIRFRPHSAFDQTPGPRAGAALALLAGGQGS